jgi:hypothetical protein
MAIRCWPPQKTAIAARPAAAAWALLAVAATLMALLA